jgi:hypothetical protein
MIWPLTTAPGGFTHVLVAIDKFTKWTEYKPITMLSAHRVVTLIRDILHHFSFPNTIVYGSEAILPADMIWKSPQQEMFEKGKADTARHLKLDSAEQIRCNVLLQSARYLQGVRRYHDRNIQRRSFNVGDMILRRIQDATGLHKLNSRWEGPFIVHKVMGPGSYRL